MPCSILFHQSPYGSLYAHQEQSNDGTAQYRHIIELYQKLTDIVSQSSRQYNALQEIARYQRETSDTVPESRVRLRMALPKISRPPHRRAATAAVSKFLSSNSSLDYILNSCSFHNVRGRFRTFLIPVQSYNKIL